MQDATKLWMKESLKSPCDIAMLQLAGTPAVRPIGRCVSEVESFSHFRTHLWELVSEYISRHRIETVLELDSEREQLETTIGWRDDNSPNGMSTLDQGTLRVRSKEGKRLVDANNLEQELPTADLLIVRDVLRNLNPSECLKLAEIARQFARVLWCEDLESDKFKNVPASLQAYFHRMPLLLKYQTGTNQQKVLLLDEHPVDRSFGVIIPTRGRCVPLLEFIVAEWCRIGIEVIVVADPATAAGLTSLKTARVLVHANTPDTWGNALQAGFEALESQYALYGADDVLPVGSGWPDRVPRIRNAISAVRLHDCRNRRYFDWACCLSNLLNPRLQEYFEKNRATYITGNAQVISREVLTTLTYRGRRFRNSEDSKFCMEAECLGFSLIPPSELTPLLIHLNGNI